MHKNARKFEEEASKAKEIQDYPKAAEFHLKAANIYESINEEKNQKWNLANYYSAKGWEFKSLRDYEKSNENLKKAENLFFEIENIEPAFTCAKYHIKQEFTKSKIEKKRISDLY